MVDRVQAQKWESTGGGGTDEDPLPAQLKPNQDGLDARAHFSQNDSSADSDVYVSRDVDDNMTFKDKVVSGEKTLSDLLSIDTVSGLISRNTGDILTSINTGEIVVSG
jgi:hypothetical protein